MSVHVAALVSALVLSDAAPVTSPHPVDPMKRALSELRSIGTVMESFAVDNDVYPGPTAGLVPVAELAEKVEPIYIKTLPRVDPWGMPYQVWSDGKTYLIVSGGSDGRLDRAYVDATVEATRANEKDTEDLVFANGQFVRWLKETTP